MTSRNLFFKLQKEDIKRRMWVIALSMLIFFLFGPVWLALELEGTADNATTKYIIAEITTIIGPGFILQYLITIAGALICACSGFFFLHSRKKVDFFQSVPVRRERLFFVNYADGILLYIIPYCISMLLNFLVLAVNGFMGADAAIAGFQALGVNLLYFLVIYTLTVLAVMLTGNGIVSILGAGVFFVYGPVVMFIKDAYSHEFFKTYHSITSDENFLTFLSPLGKYIYKSQHIQNGEYKGLGLSILMTVAVIILLLVLNLLFYRKRPSEAAGKAMAFDIVKPVIKFLLLIPITLGGGLVFRGAAGSHSDGWMIFGLILGFLITSAIVEVIYQFDLKKAFSHRLGLAVAALVTTAVVCVFRFDLISYDTYIPDKDKVVSMSIRIPGVDENKNYVTLNKEGTGYDHYLNFEYEEKYMRLKNFDAAYDIAKLGIKEINKTDKDNASDKKYSSMVAFHLKNGRTVIRNYPSVADKEFALLKQIYSDDDFKEGYYPIYQWKSDNITSVSAFNYLGEKEFTLTEKEKEELLETYKEELKALTIEDIMRSKPLGSLRLTLVDNRPFEYELLPEFTRTLEFLSAHGFQSDNQIKPENIKKVTVVKQFQEDTVNTEAPSINKDALEQVDYTGKEQIETILQAAIPSEYGSEFYSILDITYDLSVSIVLGTDTYGNETSQTYYFSRNNVPDFVKKDLKYNPQ